MFSVANFMESDSEEECPALIRRRIRDSANPLDLPNFRFLKLFRLSKEAFKELLDEITPFLKDRTRGHAIPNFIKLAAALRFFAEGSYQQAVGQDFNVGLAQSTFSEVLAEIINIFQNCICEKWIKFNLSAEEKREAQLHFFTTKGFPGVIGAVDGTHVDIVAPVRNEHLYVNRKCRHSINVMVVCDHKMRIRSVDARFAGSSHDSMVWEMSDLRRHLEENHTRGESCWLLGDSGYPLEPWLITPFRSASEGSREAEFNKMHSKCRVVIERTIGLLKNRFRCLLGARQLHYAPEKGAKIINACVALHNICLHYNVAWSPLEDNGIHTMDGEDVNEVNEENHADARIIRNNIMNSML